jgi:hypothetical protein
VFFACPATTVHVAPVQNGDSVDPKENSSTNGRMTGVFAAFPAEIAHVEPVQLAPKFVPVEKLSEKIVVGPLLAAGNGNRLCAVQTDVMTMRRMRSRFMSIPFA